MKPIYGILFYKL